ncbi:hypothetical protein PAXRUDRAFT_830420, partial [Paxillus rubicundulus Ve08.2h10]
MHGLHAVRSSGATSHYKVIGSHASPISPLETVMWGYIELQKVLGLYYQLTLEHSKSGNLNSHWPKKNAQYFFNSYLYTSSYLTSLQHGV